MPLACMARPERGGAKERKCMGIEPTSRMFNMRLNDFEDRGRHQACKHFRAFSLL